MKQTPAKPRFDRAALKAEFGATLTVAGPLAAANLSQMAMGVTDTVMVGYLGGAPLAAVGLGGGLYFTVCVVFQGVVSAVSPLAAHAIGAGDPARAGRIGGGGIALALLIGLPLAAVMVVFEQLLVDFGYDPMLAAQIGRFLRAIAWGAPGFILFAALRGFLAASRRASAVMVVVALCIPTNALLNWLLIFGNWGFPAWGVAGSGAASAINQWLMAGGLALAVAAARGLRHYRVFAAAFGPGWREVRGILALGLPIGGIMGTEIGVFITASVLIGLLGADALGAHQIALNFSSLTFMVPLGIGQAATVRVAGELGAGNPAAARRAAAVALALGIAFMSGTAILLWAAPRTIVGLYVRLDDPANRAIVELAVRLCWIAALYQVFDGAQTIAAGALRGYKDTAVPMLLAVFGYWGIGFVTGIVLAFPLGYGVVGLWWGLALGLFAVAAMLGARIAWHARAAGSDRQVAAAD